jgi:hypothetical protein
MHARTALITSLALAASLVSGAAHAVLQGRDLNGSAGSFEAYYDTDLNITWLANANMNGAMDWTTANTWVANLSFYDAINNINYDNWRLPTVNPVNGASFNYSYAINGSTDFGYNVSEQGTAFAGSTGSEMAHLFYNTLNNPGYYTPAGAVSGCYANSSNTCLDNTGPFTNLQANYYWSATERAPSTNYAWGFYFGNGGQDASDEGGSFYALAVSPGDVAAVPEADTWAMLLAGLTLVGAATRRRRG